MGPAKVRIYFDSPTACYSPGERIKGKVVLILDREKQIIGIDLNRIGKAKVTGMSRNNPRRRGRRMSRREAVGASYVDSVSLLKDSIQLRRQNDEQRLPEGTYEYPFCWLLPDNLPASFEGPFGWTTYRLEVVVRYSFWDHRCEAEADFFVTGKFDLNNLDPCFRQVTVESKIMYFGGRNYVDLTLELDKKAFVPGEIIRFAVTPDYRSEENGRTPLPGVHVALIQVQTYRINDNLKKNAVNVSKLSGPMIFPNSIEVMNGQIPVPPVPPTALGGGCWFIDIQYYLRVKLELTETKKIEFNIKMLVGTIPFKRRRSRPPSFTMDNVQRELSIELPSPAVVTPADEGNSIGNERNRFSSFRDQIPTAGISRDYLSVQPGPSRRASAPPLWLDSLMYPSSPPGASPERNGGVNASSNGEPETPPPTYSDAVFFSSVGFLETTLPSSSQTSRGELNDDEPPEYQRPPPFFLRKGASHLFDSYDGYSTL